MRRALATLLLVACSTNSCSFQVSSNHRLVGTVQAGIADAKTLTTLEIDNRSGTIVIRESAAEQASVSVDVLLNEKRPETDFTADFDKHARLVRTGNQLAIHSVHDQASDAQEWQLRYTIHVPAGIALRLDQGAGQLDVELPHTKDIHVDSAAGAIAIAVGKVTGKVVANLQSGEIQLTVADTAPSGGCTLDCTAGTVTLTLPKGTSGRYDLSAITGDVSVASHYGIRPQRSVTTMTAHGQVGSGGPTFHAHVVTGVVRLR